MVPTYGIVWCCFTVKGHRLWDGLLGGSANGPQIWDKCPGWVGVMPPKVTIYGSAACQEHERTPDMGHRAGMVRPDSPQRSPSMGCAPHGPPARGLLAAPRLGAAPPDPRGGGHPRPRRRRAGSPTPSVARGIGFLRPCCSFCFSGRWLSVGKTWRPCPRAVAVPVPPLGLDRSP